MSEDSAHPDISTFIAQNSLDSAHAYGFAELFDSIEGDPLPQIDRYLVRHGLDRALAEPACGLYAQVSRVAGRYLPLEPIGDGTAGEVWRVRDERLETSVAMKRLRRDHLHNPRLVARFELEWRILSHLDHPNIPAVFDRGTLRDGRPWFTMPLVEGVEFDASVAAAHQQLDGSRWGPGEPGWAAISRLLRSFVGVCGAAAEAHRAGIVHCDLSARNIRLGAHEQAYVLDWGIAQWHRDTSGPPAPPVEVVGTPYILAPERIRKKPIDARCDVYALGVLLYRLLSNRWPYDGPDEASILAQIVAGPPLLSPGTRGAQTTYDPSRGSSAGSSFVNTAPEALCALCVKAMHHDPDQRLASAESLAEALGAWLDGARRRSTAMALVGSAAARNAQIRASRALADAQRAEGRAELQGVQPWEPEEAKWPG
ncbi:MAG: serine/threonine-protein kinase, partial [Myxococcota bacterium]